MSTYADSKNDKFETSLAKRNVKINEHRTSIRLEPALWQALESIATLENTTINEICTEIGAYAHGNGFTSAVRVYIVNYFMNARREAVAEQHIVDQTFLED